MSDMLEKGQLEFTLIDEFDNRLYKYVVTPEKAYEYELEKTEHLINELTWPEDEK